MAAIEVSGIKKHYESGGESVVALDEITFTVDKGTVVGILGPNGAGKTTLIKILLGIITPTAGTAHVNGVPVKRGRSALYENASAMLEGARNVYWRLTVEENLAFFARLAGVEPSEKRDRHEVLLDRLELSGHEETPVNKLSRGMKQKVALAATLARDTPVMFLDEPTLGLDVESSLELRRELGRLVNDEDQTVVLSSHDMDVIEDLCDRVIVLQGGEMIVDDTVEQLVGLFDTQTYRISLETTVSENVRREIEQGFDVRNWDRIGERDRFTIDVATTDAFYKLVDILEKDAYPVAQVEAAERDLERAFLTLLEREETV